MARPKTEKQDTTPSGEGMTPMRLSIAAATLLALTASAAAQFLGPGMPLPGAAPPPPQQQQQPPCFNEFAPLRGEAEKRAGVLQAAVKRKVPREELCNLIKSFSVAEAKVLNFVEKNQQTCGVPPTAVTQMKANHQRTIASTNQVCAAGPTAARPSGPGLSEALGVSRAPSSIDTLAPKSGTMDTLTGNVLQR
jgi:hypothetical protein